jgi:hypothetical protein
MRESQDDTFEEWEEMVQAAREDEPELAAITPFRTVLESAHVEAVACKRHREKLSASRQEATQRLYRALAEGRDAASRLRHFVKSVYGPRSDKLVRYGIKLRKLRRPPRKPVS